MFSRITPEHRAYAPPVHGLIGKVFRDLGHEVTMLSTALPGGFAGVRETDHATVHHLPRTTAGKLGPDFWRETARAFDAMHAERPFDLVFGRGEATWGFHRQSRAAGQLPVIAHEGTYPLWLHQVQRRLPGRADALVAPLALLRMPFERVYRTCLQRATLTVCNSPALAEALPRIYWWNPPRTTFIPYGFDLAPWSALRDRTASGSRSQPPRIVFVGRMTADKGVYDMVDILSRLRHATAVIEAIGPMADNVARRLRAMLAERGLTDRFLIPGPERNENLPQRLHGASAFLFPSTHPEGLSKSVMEAMAAGLPVLAYAIPGMDALVESGRTGWLLRPRDFAGAAEKLDLLLSTPDLAQGMGAAGRQRLSARFTPEAATANWARVLSEVVTAKGGASA